MSVRDERAMKVLILSQFLTGSISIINYFVSSYLLRVVNRCFLPYYQLSVNFW